MKMRTVRRGIIILCLMCILAACARESAPAEEAPAADTGVTHAAPAPAEPDWLESSEECLRVISDCLGQNEGPQPRRFR